MVKTGAVKRVRYVKRILCVKRAYCTQVAEGMVVVRQFKRVADVATPSAAHDAQAISDPVALA